MVVHELISLLSALPSNEPIDIMIGTGELKTLLDGTTPEEFEYRMFEPEIETIEQQHLIIFGRLTGG
jgi:hypothetical protein